MNKKYTKQELTEFAKGIFRDDKTSPSIYANEEGTFLNSAQYEERKKEGTHGEFKHKFDNPATKKSDSVASAEVDDLKSQIKSLNETVEDLEDDKAELSEKLSDRDAEIAKLKESGSKLKTELTTAQGNIKALEAEVAALKKAAPAEGGDATAAGKKKNANKNAQG